MRKNVNNEVTMNPPIQNYTYPDDLAPATAYDSILQFLYPGYQRFFLACDEELRRPQADTSSAFGRRHERRSREKKSFRTGHFLRLDRNRKPRMKSLWHPRHSFSRNKEEKKCLYKVMSPMGRKSKQL